MTVAAGDILRIVCAFLWTDGNVNMNIFNALVSGAGAPWDDQDILDDAEAWADNMYANYQTAISSDLDGNSVTVYKYDVSGADWDEVGSNAWSFAPVNVGEQLPRGTAPLVRLWTEDPDVQGKKYIPGHTEGDLDDGLYDASVLTNSLAFAADWYLPFTGGTSGGTWTPGIWSVAQTAFKAGVDHIAASAVPAYQRRRKRTVGI